MGGINGSGKSFLAKEVTLADPAFEVAHTTSMFMNWLGFEDGDYPRLRQLSSDLKSEENSRMLSSYLREVGARGISSILDSHYLNMVEGHITRLVDGDWPRLLGGLVLVEADVGVVHQRITEDNNKRQRHLFPKLATPGEQRDLLQTYQTSTREEFRGISTQFDLPNRIIRNDGPIEAARDDFLDFHYNIIKQGQSE